MDNLAHFKKSQTSITNLSLARNLLSNKTELERLVAKLNHRISTLSVRYGETGDTELETILLSYSDSLDSYNGFIAKLDELMPEEEDEFGDDFDDDFGAADF